MRSVVNVSTGEIVQRIDYDEYGNITYNSNPDFTPFGFCGGLYDTQTKLVRFGARDYDASVGRWLSKDPINFAGGLNFYIYCANDPVNHVDLFGLQTFEEIVKQILAVGLFDAQRAAKLAEESLKVSADTKLLGPQNGPQDAFRHCYWSCRMAQELGIEQAEKIGDIHEGCGNNPPGEMNMDTHNNGIGRVLGGIPGIDCEQECLNVLNVGLLKTSPGGSPPSDLYNIY